MHEILAGEGRVEQLVLPIKKITYILVVEDNESILQKEYILLSNNR